MGRSTNRGDSVLSILALQAQRLGRAPIARTPQFIPPAGEPKQMGANDRLPGRSSELPISTPTSFASPAGVLETDDSHLPDEVRRDLYAGRLIREFYVYALRSDRTGGTTVAANSTEPDYIQIDPDSDFEAVAMTSDTRSSLNVRLYDGGGPAVTDIMSGQVAAASIFGTGAQPYWWPMPLFLARATVLRFDITNTTGGALPYNFYLLGSRLVG